MNNFFNWFTGADAKQHFMAIVILILLLGVIIFGGFRDDLIMFVDKHPDILTMILGAVGIGAAYVGPKKTT